MMITQFRSDFANLALAILIPLPAFASDWPQWRGPDRTDLSTETGLVREWSTDGPPRLWLFKEAGIGYSGPSIADGKIFLMGGREPGEMLICLDEKSGKELWATEIGKWFKEGHGDGPRGTPTVDGDRVYAMGGQGTLICARVADGKQLWSVSMSDLGGRGPKWGYTESVLVDGDKVICTPGGSEGTVAALHKLTGKRVWQTEDFGDQVDYSSIVPAEFHGERQYVRLTQKTLAGLSAEDGKVKWKVEWPGRIAVVPTPIIRDNNVYVTSGYGVGCMLVRIEPSNKVVEVYSDNKVMKNHHGGVILVGDHLYGHSDPAGWICQDFMTGEEVWSERKALGKGAVAYADGMLYCLDERRGTVVLVEASPKGWSEHGRFTLSPLSDRRASRGGVWTHPVIANGRLYLRDQELFFCFDISGK